MRIFPFLINLERRPDRYSHFMKQWSSPDIEIFRAIDGRTLGQTDYILAKFAHADFMFDKFKIACFLSHISVIRNFIKKEDRESVAIIFEDDVIFKDLPPQKGILETLSKVQEFDILYLGGSIPEHTPKNIPSKYGPDILQSEFRTACSYCLSFWGAQKILDAFDTEPPKRAYDCWLNDLPVSKYVLSRDLCDTSRALGTDIQGKFESLLPELNGRFVHIIIALVCKGDLDYLRLLSDHLRKSGYIPAVYGIGSAPAGCDILLTTYADIDSLLSRHDTCEILIGRDGQIYNLEGEPFTSVAFQKHRA
jgi:Glycosyltransferase family 25 (LPS biosynthesis protein)